MVTRVMLRQRRDAARTDYSSSASLRTSRSNVARVPIGDARVSPSPVTSSSPIGVGSNVRFAVVWLRPLG